MNELVAYLLLFLGLGVFFVFIHLVMGRFIRPVRPDPEKLTIYECGEPTICSAWIQFDLRFYVVALLFVIFDVEVVFFFPWAVVFGKATTLAKELPAEQRLAVSQELTPPYLQSSSSRPGTQPAPATDRALITPNAAMELAWVAFWDIMVFFGVLLVGFAYLWKRGDLDWVRSVMAERTAAAEFETPAAANEAGVLIGAAPD